MLQIAVVGYGYWGPNLVRNFMENDKSTVAYVCDGRQERLELVRTRYPTIKTTTEFQDLLDSPEVDAIVVATPVSTHYPLALKALQAGKHVLVEKPLSDSSEKCQHLIDVAREQGKLLMVDHTFPYTGAVSKIKELVDSGELGEILYYDSVRINLGLFQRDVSVIWDLAVHDLSIIDYVLPTRPIAVSATGISHVEGQPENMAYLTLFFPGNTMAHIHVNWLAPVKIRQVLIGGSKKMIVYDDIENSEKVKIYDKGLTMESDMESIHKMLISYRIGDMWAPNIDRTEALRYLASQFIRGIETGEAPISDAQSGLRVVQIMEAATQSILHRGKVINLPKSGA